VVRLRLIGDLLPGDRCRLFPEHRLQLLSLGACRRGEKGSLVFSLENLENELCFVMLENMQSLSVPMLLLEREFEDTHSSIIASLSISFTFLRAISTLLFDSFAVDTANLGNIE